MNPADITAARTTLGLAWGVGRPLHRTELARVLGLKDPRGATVANWESGAIQITGPASLAIEALLAGYTPPDLMSRVMGVSRRLEGRFSA